MHFFADIFFIGIGVAGMAFAIAHEFYWWKRPEIGDEVPIVVSSAENEAAEISRTHRLSIPLAFGAFDVISIIVGAHVKPIGEQAGTDQAATRSEPNWEGGDKPQSESELRSRSRVTGLQPALRI